MAAPTLGRTCHGPPHSTCHGSAHSHRSVPHLTCHLWLGVLFSTCTCLEIATNAFLLFLGVAWQVGCMGQVWWGRMPLAMPLATPTQVGCGLAPHLAITGGGPSGMARAVLVHPTAWASGGGPGGGVGGLGGPACTPPVCLSYTSLKPSNGITIA